jgi:hypothetical protein
VITVNDDDFFNSIGTRVVEDEPPLLPGEIRSLRVLCCGTPKNATELELAYGGKQIIPRVEFVEEDEDTGEEIPATPGR